LYVKGSLDTNSCPAGSIPLTSVGACQAAAGALSGLSWGKSYSWSGDPKGCIAFSDGNLYFNTDSTGSANSDHRPICGGCEAGHAPLATPLRNPTVSDAHSPS
jgi:hypothetical protein